MKSIILKCKLTIYGLSFTVFGMTTATASYRSTWRGGGGGGGTSYRSAHAGGYLGQACLLCSFTFCVVIPLRYDEFLSELLQQPF